MVTGSGVARLAHEVKLPGSNSPMVRMIEHVDADHLATDVLLAALQGPERAAVMRYRDTAARRAAALRRLLVRAWAAEVTGMALVDLRVISADCERCERPHGRPRLDGADLEISFSGTRECSAIALHSAAVGIDIETRFDETTAQALAAHVPDVSRVDLQAAIRTWVTLEAEAKMTGVGLVEHIRGGTRSAGTSVQILVLPAPVVGAVAYMS